MFTCPFVNCHSPANSSETVFNAHLRLFHRNRTGEIICRLCKFAEHFSTFTTWKNHMKRVHGNVNSIGRSKDLKKYGEDLLWKKWIEEMKGIDDPLEITRNGRTYKFLVRFVEVTGDNKALNALCGFRQCFSSGRFCRDCEIDYTELESNIELSTLQLRTLSRYDSAIGQLSNRPAYVTDVTENVGHDLMHDGLEGIARIEIRRIVRVLSQQGVSLSTINNRIKTFAYGRIDRSNKPEVISLTQVSLGQRAFQALTMFRLIPWILRGLGELPPSFHSAVQLISLLLSPRFSRNIDLNRIAELAEKYLETSLSGADNEEEEEDREDISQRRSSRIKPKQHFFLHYSSSIMKNGPPRLNWYMTYESLLSFAKRVSYATCNYTNLPLTIASAYQRHLHYLRMSPYDEITPTRPISTTEFEGLNYRGFEIRSNDFLVVSFNLLPLFGKVISFSRTNSEWSVTVRQYVTDRYEEKFNAYMVVETTVIATFALCNVHSVQPLDGYGTDESDMLTARRIDKGREEVIFHGQCPLPYGTIRELAEYISTRQIIDVDQITIQDMYTEIELDWDEQIDLMRGYKDHRSMVADIVPKREYDLLEMSKVRMEEGLERFDESHSMDYNGVSYETSDAYRTNENEEMIDVESIDMQERRSNMIDQIQPKNNNENEMARKRVIPSSTSLSLSGYSLKAELSSVSMKDVLKDGSESEQILREISNGSSLEITPVRRCHLMRAVATYLLINCRNQYNPSYIEKLSFVSKLFHPYPQFDPVTLCQSGGSISKTISYSRRVLSANQLLQKRSYRRKESSVADSIDLQKERLKELDSTPVGSEAYRSIMNQTRQYRLLILQSSVFEDILSGHSSLIVDPNVMIIDLERTDGIFSSATFESEWRNSIVPNLLSTCTAEDSVHVETLRNDCGGIDDLVACFILLNRINKTVVGESRRGKRSHFFSQFPSELTTSEALERLRSSKIPFPSLFRIGSQSTIMIYLGDVGVPIPSISVSKSLIFIVALVTFSTLSFPRSLARFYQFLRFVMRLKGSKLHDSLFSLYGTIKGTNE